MGWVTCIMSIAFIFPLHTSSSSSWPSLRKGRKKENIQREYVVFSYIFIEILVLIFHDTLMLFSWCKRIVYYVYIHVIRDVDRWAGSTPLLIVYVYISFQNKQGEIRVNITCVKMRIKIHLGTVGLPRCFLPQRYPIPLVLIYRSLKHFMDHPFTVVLHLAQYFTTLKAVQSGYKPWCMKQLIIVGRGKAVT